MSNFVSITIAIAAMSSNDSHLAFLFGLEKPPEVSKNLIRNMSVFAAAMREGGAAVAGCGVARAAATATQTRVPCFDHRNGSRELSPVEIRLHSPVAHTFPSLSVPRR
jgi:hypothetical protein